MILTKMKFVFLTLMFLLPALPMFSQDRVADNAGLLSAGERINLMSRLNSIASSYNFDLVIVTENSIGGASPMNYADDFFDYKGYGSGNDRDGCLFLVVTGTWDYWFSTSGRGENILNSTAYKKLESDAVKSLRADNYYAAFNSFLDDWEKFLALDAQGRSYNFFYRWNVVLVVICWLLGTAIGFIVVMAWKSGMNSALAKTQAESYAVPGSLAFTEKKDTFLYSTVTKTKRQTDDSSSSSGRTHTSSSGRSHGGGGGKYR